MSDFHKVNSALSSMKIESPTSTGKTRSSSSGGAAPLATSEDVDQHGYAVPRDNLVGLGRAKGPPPKGPPPPLPTQTNEYAQPILEEQQQQDSKRPHHPRPKHRERREQLAMMQGTFTFRL